MRKLVGRVGVDSGQIMIVDPCYAVHEEGDTRETTLEQHGFGYKAICHATTDMSKVWPELGPFKGDDSGVAELGRSLAVVTGNFGGDGVFPVYAEFGDNGMVRSLTVEFDYEEDEDQAPTWAEVDEEDEDAEIR